MVRQSIFKCENLNDLTLFLKEFRSEKNILVLGESNILLSDNLYDGAVIKLGKIFQTFHYYLMM